MGEIPIGAITLNWICVLIIFISKLFVDTIIKSN